MAEIRELVEAVHASPTRVVIAVAGAGSQAVAWLLAVPGASRTLLEAVVPYERQALIDFLGHEPEQFVSTQTATELAGAAYRRALRLREDQSPVLGLACTASLATDRPKRGEHRGCIAAWDEAGVVTHNLVLAKGRRDRSGEEEQLSRLLLNALARACRLPAQLPLDLVEGEAPEVRREAHGHPIDRLLSGGVRTVTVQADGRAVADEPFRGAVLPGSFNPLHQGHLDLASAAAGILGCEVALELSVLNVDKPPLGSAEVRRRVAQFQGKARLLLTRAETFRKKADVLPGCVYVMGWDTAVRLLEPRYYGGQGAMLRALAEMGSAGCRFLVAGRTEGGVFRTLADVPAPPGFEDLFQAIPESAFRSDLSSTDLRAAQ